MKKLTQRQMDAQYRVFSALSNLKRITVLNYLRSAKGPVTAADIEKGTGISNPSVYEQLKVLRTAGLVKPLRKSRNGPVATNIELTDKDAGELNEFLAWFEGAAAFKKLFKTAPQARPQLRVVGDDMAGAL